MRRESCCFRSPDNLHPIIELNVFVMVQSLKERIKAFFIFFGISQDQRIDVAIYASFIFQRFDKKTLADDLLQAVIFDKRGDKDPIAHSKTTRLSLKRE